MLEGKSTGLGNHLITKAKRKANRVLVGYLEAGGYTTEADPDFKEANINDLVTFTLNPILPLFKLKTSWRLHLSREKEISSLDSITSGMEEFVVMDCNSLEQTKYVLIVEVEKVSLGEAQKQCLHAMKDMRGCNGGGIVYGFITMGDSWRTVSFDGEFKISEKMELLFDTVGKAMDRWMKNYSILVACFNVALSSRASDPAEVV